MNPTTGATGLPRVPRELDDGAPDSAFSGPFTIDDGSPSTTGDLAFDDGALT